jgi:hypothetical protein
VILTFFGCIAFPVKLIPLSKLKKIIKSHCGAAYHDGHDDDETKCDNHGDFY